MKLIYLTSQKYPSKKTDPFFIQSMAGAFSKIRGNDFLFVVRGSVPDELKNLPALSVNLPKRFRTVSYFLYLPILIMRNAWSDSEIVFFSSDPYLLATLVFWRKVLRFKYRICSDWHQLFDDWRDRYVATNSNYLISTSKRLKDILVSTFEVDPSKIIVAYGGVHKELFDAKTSRDEYRSSLGLPDDAFLVGYIGAFKCMGMDKGIVTMIKALPFLPKEVTMVFVGALKQDVDEYTLLTEKEGVQDRCIFVRKQPYEKVIEYEMVMDVLTIPYPDKHHFREYGFPMKVWEYMASGRPIIYSDLEIMGEVLKGRAVSFKPDDASSFANAVLNIKKDVQAAEVIAAQNMKDVEEYTWKARATKIVHFIEPETKSKKETVLNLFHAHAAVFEEQIWYMKSESNKMKRAFHNIGRLGLSYVVYSLSRFKLSGFLKDIHARFFFGKVVTLPADDLGANVFAMYGILPHKSERRLTLWMLQNLKDDDVFYDDGGHMGYYTAIAEKMVTRGEIHTFEANKKLCGYLNQNFLDAKNVHIECTAIADVPGEVDFYDATEAEDSSASSRFLLSGRNIAPTKVQAITLDQYVSRGNKLPTVIKLDIEGGEYDAILGALNMLQNGKPSILMEIWGDENGRKYSDKAVKKLQKLGYNAFMLRKDGNVVDECVSDPVKVISTGHGDEARDNFLFLKK